MKLPRLHALDPRKRRSLANHLFFASAACLFVIHQHVLKPEAVAETAPFVAQALNAQPRTPPPGYDPDQMSGEEYELDLSIRPEGRPDIRPPQP